MIVKELIKELMDFNQLADVKVIALGNTHLFKIGWGTKKNSIKEDCDMVMLSVENK